VTGAGAAEQEVQRAVAERVAAVRARIDAAARRAGRHADEVTLVAVSKRVPASRVAAAVAAGCAHLGESYVQEAHAKVPEVHRLLDAAGAPRPCWHLVGRLQRNKARDAVRDFAWVESVDRLSLARALDARAGREAGRAGPLPVLLQVNLSGAPQKGGAAPDELPALLEACGALPGLDVRGLMTVPAAADDPEASRPVFARLRGLRDALRARPGGAGLRELSMGMSGDLEVAVEEGATIVRVGTAIFGLREG